MYQQQPPQWQPPRPRPKKPVPRWAWYIAGGWVAVFVGMVVLVAVFDPPKDQAAPPVVVSRTTSAKPSPSSSRWLPSAVQVTKAKLGKDWPFKDTTRGYVGCDVGHPGAIIFNPGDGPYLGRPFAINGTALDAGYPDVPKKIWLPDPSIPDPEARISVGPLQDLAPNRCEP